MILWIILEEANQHKTLLMVCTERAREAEESLSRPEVEKKAREVKDEKAGGFLRQVCPKIQDSESSEVINSLR